VRNLRFSDGKKHCNQWYTDYVGAIILIYILAMVMQNMNVMIKVVLRMVSKFEKREDKTEEVISNTFKMFVIQLANTAILLLIVNAKLGFIPSWFPFFGGQYDDFTTDWYSDVGTTLMITMFFAIFSPHMANA